MSKIKQEPSGPQTINPTVQKVKQNVVKLLSKKRDDPTVQTPGIVKTARCVFQKIQYEFFYAIELKSKNFGSDTTVRLY